MEAEYVSTCQATKEAVWLRAFMKELQLDTAKPLLILTDSQGSMALSKNPGHHQRSKHIDIRYHFVREQVALGSVDFKYVPTSNMAADQLTKPLAQKQHEHCVQLMGIRP